MREKPYYITASSRNPKIITSSKSTCKRAGIIRSVHIWPHDVTYDHDLPEAVADAQERPLLLRGLFWRVQPQRRLDVVPAIAKVRDEVDLLAAAFVPPVHLGGRAGQGAMRTP